MSSERHDPLDRLLDDALAAYVSQEPRLGFERRVLNRIHAEAKRRSFPIPNWVWPIAALGCLVAAFAVWNQRAPAPAPPEVARTEVNPPAAAAATAEPAKPLRRQPRNRHRARASKEPEFPVRAPLTRQERALVAFIRSAPDDALETFGEKAPAKIEPLRIDQIQLPPLQISDGAK